MIGVSWGGFAALQAASRNPPALRGIVPIHASDDRYADDVHYFGGCVLATDMVHWSACMTAFLGPAARSRGGGRRLARRLARARRGDGAVGRTPGSPTSAATTTGARARRASATRRSPARCSRSAAGPTATATWSCAWSSTAAGRCAGLIGPWGHTGPEAGAPGPAIGFLQEVVRFFDHALKGEENGFFDEPALIAYMQERDRAGHGLRRAARALGGRRRLAVAERGDADAGRSAARRARCAGCSSPGCRPACGAATAGRPTAPADQRPEDGASLCWDTAPLDERIELLGHVVAELELSADRPAAFVAARLCDVAPDGSSSLIARGVLNLTHREGHDRVVPVVPGEPMTVRVPMQSTAYAVPAGHALRLADLADLLAVDLAVARAGDADRRRRAGRAAGARAVARWTPRCARSARPSRAPALAKEYSLPGADGADRAPRPRLRHGGRRVPVDRPPPRDRRQRHAARRAQRRALRGHRGRPAVGGGARRGRRRAGARRLADARARCAAR